MFITLRTWQFSICALLIFYSSCRVDCEQDILLQCKLLLSGLEALDPNIQSLIRSTSKTRLKKHNLLADNQPIAWSLERKRDPFSHLKMLIQQGALLCELSKLDRIFRCTNKVDIISIKEQCCIYPEDIVVSKSSTSLNDPEHGQLTNLRYFLHNSGAFYHLPSLVDLQSPNTSIMLDMIDLLEEWTSKLFILLPKYPVIGSYDSSSESDRLSDSSGSCYSQSSTISQKEGKKKCTDAWNKNAIQELETTERKYVETLVKMHEYEIECKALLERIRSNHDKVRILVKRLAWFPHINELREFHVQFFIQIQIVRSSYLKKDLQSIERFTSAFGAFHDAIHIYNEWISSFSAVGIEILQQAESAPNMFPLLDELIPLDKSTDGMASLRIQPMQRLLRYPLLLKELMRGITDEQSLFHLEAAHLIMTSIGRSVNEQRKKQENILIKEKYIHMIGPPPESEWSQQLHDQDFWDEGIAVIRSISQDELDSSLKYQRMTEERVRILLFEKGLYILEQESHVNPNMDLSASKHYSVPALTPDRSLSAKKSKIHLKRTMTNLRKAYRDRGRLQSGSTQEHEYFKPIRSIPFKSLQEVYRLAPTTMRCVMEGDWQDIQFENKETTSSFYTHCRKALSQQSGYQGKMLRTIQNCKVHLCHGSDHRSLTDIIWTVLRVVTKSGSIIQYEAFAKQISSQIGIMDRSVRVTTCQEWSGLKIWYLDEDEDRVRLQTNEDVEMALEMNIDVLTLFVA